MSALEVILTTLHSGGGKFSGKVYATSGGLHGVGGSVVNALSEKMDVEVARDRVLWKQSYAKGKPTSRSMAGRCTTGAAQWIRFSRTQRFSARWPSARRGVTASRFAPRRICSVAWRIPLAKVIRRC